MGCPDGVEIGIACQRCGRVQTKKAVWVRANRKIACACGMTTDFDSQELIRRAAVATASRAPASFEREPPIFGKRRLPVR